MAESKETIMSQNKSVEVHSASQKIKNAMANEGASGRFSASAVGRVYQESTTSRQQNLNNIAQNRAKSNTTYF